MSGRPTGLRRAYQREHGAGRSAVQRVPKGREEDKDRRLLRMWQDEERESGAGLVVVELQPLRRVTDIPLVFFGAPALSIFGSLPSRICFDELLVGFVERQY